MRKELLQLQAEAGLHVLVGQREIRSYFGGGLHPQGRDGVALRAALRDEDRRAGVLGRLLGVGYRRSWRGIGFPVSGAAAGHEKKNAKGLPRASNRRHRHHPCERSGRSLGEATGKDREEWLKVSSESAAPAGQPDVERPGVPLAQEIERAALGNPSAPCRRYTPWGIMPRTP